MDFKEFRKVVLEEFPGLDEGQLAAFEAMEALYADWNSKINVISRKDIGELYRHHVLHSLCIASYLQRERPDMHQALADGRTVLDVGTGSGILAIAALLLGAKSAEGVDIDPMCVRTAGENARLNGVQEQFQVLVGDLSDQAEGQYDIITANIVAAAILSLAPDLPSLMGPDTLFIASGIIDQKKDEVIAGLQKVGLQVVDVREKRGWECILARKA